MLRTKLSSTRDNPLLIDNYAVKALRTTFLTFKEFGELHKALKEQIQISTQSNNPWINILMKSMNIGSSINEHITDEAIDNMIDSMLGKE